MTTKTTKPSASLVNITPKMAGDWLSKNDHNRNVRSAVVSAYARDMEAGNWQVTGEAIKFNCDGSLLDGQHRLLAIIRSGQTVPILVVKGLPRTAQDVMDTGAKRAAADMLKLNGYINSTVLASAARLLLVLRETTSSSTGNAYRTFTNTEIAEFVKENPELQDAANAASSLYKHIDLTPSVLAVVWHWLNKANPEACAEFFGTIAENATSGAGDPRNTLIRRLGTARRNGEHLTQATQLSFVVRAWNAWRAGDKLSILKDRASDGKGGSTAVSIPKVSP